MDILWYSLFGGLLLGISATLLMLFNGKVAGISGIVTYAISATKGDVLWRYLFLAGLVCGGWLGAQSTWSEMPSSFSGHSSFYYAIAGLLVGIGTRLGNGCTSGHGICGIGRLSPRSIIATITFMLVAGITVFFTVHVLGMTR
ncbi:YeeE/YedE family protein [Vibrio tritonius]|uniref:YeeE/YedE family protein n=1 Tax=Vibrio tritonius TaxID=1435069 RepID=UPI000838E204|nr:YeeE/YedE family protein [Vibrio tritonius]